MAWYEHEVTDKMRESWVISRRMNSKEIALYGRDGGTATCLPVTPERVGFVPDAQQAALLACTDKRVVVCCTRQWGKSSVTALKVAMTMTEKAGATVVVMSPSERQSGEFLKKVAFYLRKGGYTKLRKDGVNALSIELANGSRVIGLPGVEATMRGFSAVDLLIVDEAARVKEQQYLAAGPMLAVKDGALWLLSTPFGARGFFWKEWELGGEEWQRIQVKATECARISPEFLEREKKRISADWYRQEYLCEFLGNENGPFRKELLEAALEEGLEDLFL
jgi:hypothetical protein